MATSRAHFTFFFCKAMRFPLSDTGSMRNSVLIMRVFARFCKRLLSLKGSLTRATARQWAASRGVSVKVPRHSWGLLLREMGPEDGSWTNTFMGNDGVPFEIELTWNRGRVEPYENGGKNSHIAFVVDDFDAAHELHEKMGCIIRENPRMGLYFIADPEGQWIEILPAR